MAYNTCICFLKRDIERNIKGEMKVTRIRGRIRKKLLDDLNLLEPEFYI